MSHSTTVVTPGAPGSTPAEGIPGRAPALKGLAALDNDARKFLRGLAAESGEGTRELLALLDEAQAQHDGRTEDVKASQVRGAIVDALTSFVDSELLAKGADLDPVTVMGYLREAVEAQAALRARSDIVPLMQDGGGTPAPDMPAPDDYTVGKLRDAATRGDLPVTSALLKAGVNPNATAEKFAEWSPLHYAAQQGHSQVAAALLQAGADPLGLGIPAS